MSGSITNMNKGYIKYIKEFQEKVKNYPDNFILYIGAFSDLEREFIKNEKVDPIRIERDTKSFKSIKELRDEYTAVNKKWKNIVQRLMLREPYLLKIYSKSFLMYSYRNYLNKFHDFGEVVLFKKPKASIGNNFKAIALYLSDREVDDIDSI